MPEREVASREMARIDDLSALPDGWHDGEGRAITLEAVRAARLLAASLKPGLYSIFPRLCGGMQFEADDHVEFRIEASGTILADTA